MDGRTEKTGRTGNRKKNQKKHQIKKMTWDSKTINVLCSLFLKVEQLKLCIVRLKGSTRGTEQKQQCQWWRIGIFHYLMLIQ